MAIKFNFLKTAMSCMFIDNADNPEACADVVYNTIPESESVAFANAAIDRSTDKSEFHTRFIKRFITRLKGG